MPVQNIHLEQIYDNPYQKRHNYNDISDLARTIAQDGLQQIPKGRQNGKGVQLKFGHRRRQAFIWLKENWMKEGLPERYGGYDLMPVDIEELTDEQMFRGATIENNQRADLSPIERMEEMKAWVEFGYTSKQIADLYPGMSDATVRGYLYFDKLTPEAKNALHTGAITQGTARAVLSLQKAAAPDVIAETLREIKDEDKDSERRWGSPRTPEEVVKDALEEQPNVKSLWVDSRGGKPRAASNDGWLLDMKNFPNKFLPSTDQEHAAIVNPDRSDDAFHRSLALFAEHAKGLPESEVNLKFIEHLENPPACTACPFYTKLDGEHYCGMIVCYSRKARAWARQRMHNASKTLGIALYDPEAVAEKIGRQLIEEGLAEYHEGGGIVERECGAYEVCGTFTVRAPLKEIMQKAAEIHARENGDAPMFVMVNARLTETYREPVFLSPPPKFMRGFMRTEYIYQAEKEQPAGEVIAIASYTKKERPRRKAAAMPILPAIT